MKETKLVRIDKETWEALNNLVLELQVEMRRRISLGEVVKILVERFKNVQ